MSEPSKNIFESSEPTVTPATSTESSGSVFGNLFDNSQSAESTQQESEIKEVEKDDMPEMIPYD